MSKKNETASAAESASKTANTKKARTAKSARKPASDRGSRPWGGSHDILNSPELELTSPVAVDALPEELAPEKPVTPASKKTTSKSAKTAKAPAADAKTEKTAAGKTAKAGKTDKTSAASGTQTAAKPTAPTHKRSQSSAAKSESAAKKTAEAAKAAPAPEAPKPAVPSGKKSRGAAPVVSPEDSIVRDADILRHEGSTLRVRKQGGSGLTYVPKAKLRVIPLGGLNEVGKNMTVLEYGDDIIIVDCGMGFPDEEEMPGIDLVIPDITYLETNRDRVRGILLTHGHEDHIGAIPYILQKINPPIYGTRLTLGIIENKLQEHTLPWQADLRCVSAGDVVRLGSSFTAEFIHVNHSIADACALAINTPLGMVVHTGDFKLDLTPIDGEMTNLTRLGELGRDGVLLLMCESTNAERPGYTPSEKKVGKAMELIFTMNPDKRLVIATFSSNVHRVQQIIDISASHGRKVAVTGRSMTNIVAAAVELGYMKVPEGVLIDIADIKRYKPEQLTLITTGSQGEPMSALYRMAFGDHSQVTLGPSDLVVLSASAIPGNEKLVGRIVNELAKMGVKVINDAAADVHVSGHACQEELKLMQGLVRPRFLMPVHGEYKHMAANRELGLAMGIPSDHIFISEIGKVLEFDEVGAKWAGTVPAGIVLVDGYGVGDVGNIVLRDRKHLAQDGLIVVVATVDSGSGLLVSGPDIVSRGFVYVRESEELMEEVRRLAADTITSCMEKNGCDWYEIKNRIKDDITKFLYTRTKRKPMILPIVMDV